MMRGSVPVFGQFLLVTSLLGACSSSSGPGSTAQQPGSAGTGSAQPTAGTGGSSSSAAGSGLANAGTLTIEVGGSMEMGGGGTGGGTACATKEADAEVERQPVDIIVVVDNSSSMQDEINAVETNINVNFATILQASGVDYRLILVSQHETKGRRTSICVLAPLSANMTCPPTPDQPAFTERFYQYSTKVGSKDSLSLLVATFDGTMPDEFGLAPQGWGAWLRPKASKVFLEITDDNSEDTTATEFTTAITGKSPQFGTAAAPTFRFHSIIGISEKATATEAWQPAEPLQTEVCTGNNDRVENPGTVYQELSLATGGLRFPLCQFTNFDAVFETIAKDVTSQATISCEFDVPAPPMGQELDLSKVAVQYDAGDGTPPKTFGQAKTRAECQPDAFFIDAATSKITLCPDTCLAAQSAKKPAIDVLFTCEPTFVPPPK